VLTPQENAFLTQIGPGTPMGRLQRRYWHPVGAASEMKGRWTKRVRLLGEDLVLFKDRTGKLGLIGEFCPHRRASLAYGIPTEAGIRCPYHGWQFDRAGDCLEQPNEPPGSAFKDKVRLAGYPVETLGGMIFAYLGPPPAPLLPRWEGFAGDGMIRVAAYATIACNWLQIMENSADPVHTEWLHGKLYEFLNERSGARIPFAKHHKKIRFQEFPFGIYKQRVLEGQTEDSDDWKVGHPLIFPNILAVGSGGGELWTMYAYQLRAPIDDLHTMHYWYSVFAPPAGVEAPAHLTADVPFVELPLRDAAGEYLLDSVDVQDAMVWEAAGPVFRRDLERLATTDMGVILYRSMLERELAKVERGEDPLGTLRDPAADGVIPIPVERNKSFMLEGFASLMRRTHVGYAPFFDELCDLFAAYSRREQLAKATAEAGYLTPK
jgi:5,5'-dehydrodivanillate O-demethylase